MPILYLVGRRYCILSAGFMGGLYALVGFVLCSFQTSGQSRASIRGTNKLYKLHVFYTLHEITKNIIFGLSGAYGHIIKNEWNKYANRQ